MVRAYRLSARGLTFHFAKLLFFAERKRRRSISTLLVQKRNSIDFREKRQKFAVANAQNVDK
jgi:hypothetical protein